MLKNKIIILFIILFIISMSKCTLAEEIRVTIVVPDRGLTFYSRAIMDASWRVFVPLRDIITSMDKATVQWEPDEGRITIDTKDHWCECWIGETKATVDGDSVYMDTPPFTYYGRTYVPVRFIGEALGKEVDWNYNTHTITLK